MVGTIQPREYFPISRVIADPSDATVYFVKAIVRNARTGATIDSLKLISMGGGIWALSWQVPADTSGQGLFISITTIVYTDAGYSSLSDMYGQEQDTFLIYDRMKWVAAMAQQISAISSGADIDYKKIGRIVTEGVVKGLEPVKKVLTGIAADIDALEDAEAAEVDLGPVLSALEALAEATAPIKGLKNADLTDLIKLVRDTHNAVAQIEIPEAAEPTDLSPVLKAIAEKPVTTVDHESIAKGITPIIQKKLDESLSPEFMDSFVKNGTSTGLLKEIVGRSSAAEPKKKKQYKKMGGKYVEV